MLKFGSRGKLVGAIQVVLGINPTTDYFGEQTQQLVKEFQRDNGLTPDGVIGYKTLLELGKSINLSANFTLYEFIHSNTAVASNIQNFPKDEHFENLKRLAATMQEVRDSVGKPMRISSGFRSAALNKAIGGSMTSAHAKGLAADFKIIGLPNTRAMAAAITAIDGLEYDQLILEFPDASSSWIHLGLSVGNPRQQRLTAVKRNGKTAYIQGHL